MNGDSEGLWACMDVPVRNYQSYIPSPVSDKKFSGLKSPVVENRKSPGDQTSEVCLCGGGGICLEDKPKLCSNALTNCFSNQRSDEHL